MSLTIAAVDGNGNVLGSELLRCLVGERRMRAHAVVIGPPGVEDLASVVQRRKQRLVQALVADAGEVRAAVARSRTPLLRAFIGRLPGVMAERRELVAR